MKKIILLQFLLVTLGANAQPKLVGALKYNGIAEGGSIFRLDRPGLSPGIIHTFNNLSPHKPAGPVTVGNVGWLVCLRLMEQTTMEDCTESGRMALAFPCSIVLQILPAPLSDLSIIRTE